MLNSTEYYFNLINRAKKEVDNIVEGLKEYKIQNGYDLLLSSIKFEVGKIAGISSTLNDMFYDFCDGEDENAVLHRREFITYCLNTMRELNQWESRIVKNRKYL